MALWVYSICEKKWVANILFDINSNLNIYHAKPETICHFAVSKDLVCLAQITLGFLPAITPSPAQVLETSQLTCGSYVINFKARVRQWQRKMNIYWVLCCSVAKSCSTFCYPMNCSTLGSFVLHCFQELAQFMSTELVMPSNHLILCCPHLLLPSIFPSIRVFSNESALRIRWPKYWSFSFSISPSNEYSGLISFRMDWLDLLAVQGTLKSLLQHHSSKA